MTEISITGTIYEYFDDIEETEIRQNIIMYMDKYNIGNKCISIKTKHKLKFKNQNGGEIYNIDLKDGNIYPSSFSTEIAIGNIFVGGKFKNVI